MPKKLKLNLKNLDKKKSQAGKGKGVKAKVDIFQRCP